MDHRKMFRQAQARRRVHFAFGNDGVDHLTWFHKVAGRPVHIYVRSGRPGDWGPATEPSRGYGRSISTPISRSIAMAFGYWSGAGTRVDKPSWSTASVEAKLDTTETSGHDRIG